MKSKTINFNRRHFALTALGGFTAIALAACGGGGGDGDEASTVNLRAAFDKIQYKMTKDEVRAVVGRNEDDESNFVWEEGDERLRVFTNGEWAMGVTWRSNNITLERALNLGE